MNINLIKKILLLTLLFTGYLLFAEEYSFNFEEFKKKPYEYVGNFQMGSDFSRMNDSSNLYKLAFLNKDDKDYWDSYFVSLKLKGSYDFYDKLKISAELQERFSYNVNNEFENNLSIYELFLNTNPSANFDFQFGKKSVKWGSGYIWNPVSFVGRQKDINDVDAGLEGFWMLKSNYVKSFSGILQNYSLTTAFIPVTRGINGDFSNEESWNFILKNYFMIANMDFDSYLFFDKTKFKKIGFDFARNILTNWEIHAEYSFERDIEQNLLNSDYALETNAYNLHNYLFGTKVLFNTNTTVILELFHNDSGVSEEQMKIFLSAIDVALSGNQSLLSTIKEFQSKNLSTQFSMKDYLYMKISQPEPFDILYFTPSAFVLYNLNDNSKMIGGEFNYSRFNNLNLKLKYNLLFGELSSEFGSKISFDKLFFEIDYVF